MGVFRYCMSPGWDVVRSVDVERVVGRGDAVGDMAGKEVGTSCLVVWGFEIG
jgi:hypothetical protein